MAKRVGLTLGKYAPLHRGHQFVFETALIQVDELIVLVYATEVTRIPLNVRAQWIRDLYPQVTVIECWAGPDGYSSERDFEIMQEQYILQRLGGRRVTHFFSSEFYGAHVSRALGALDCRVDEARLQVPVSATQIRQQPFEHRHDVADVVYRDMITKVVFVGAMSTGKTTLTEALARQFGTTYAPEYGRAYWTEHQVNRRIGLPEFDIIARRHQALEDAALREANRFLFVDTNAITTYMFCMDYHGQVSPDLAQLAQDNATRYDVFFLCEDDIAYEDTWDRSGVQKRSVFQQQIVADLQQRRIPYIPLRGDLTTRMATVASVLEVFEPFAHFYGQAGLKQVCPVD